MTINRRNFLAGLSAAGTLAMLPRSSVIAQRGGGNSPRRIDVHHHFIPEAYTAYQTQFGRGGGNVAWTLAKDLEDMDQSGTLTALVSITNPGFPLGNTEDIRKAMRACNEGAAKLRMDRPGRFGSFASIPMTDVEGALKEIEYSLDTLQADGIGIFSNYADAWLGNAKFAPIYEELNRRKTIVYIHPIAATCCGNLGLASDSVPNEGAMIEFPVDTTRTIASLIFSGTTLKFPNITFITSHGGGVMPFIIERFLQGGATAEIVPGIVTHGQGGQPVKNLPTGQDVLRELRKLYYDTAMASNPVAMDALRKVVPVSQILFGTDYWFRTAVDTGNGIDGNKVFNEAELRAINRGNVERILPRYKS